MSINFINKSRPFEINSQIIEWDIKRAGLGIIKEYKMIPEDVLSKFENLSKEEFDIAIGKYQIKHKDFSREFENKFTEVMQWFISVNNLDTDLDIVSIKKDACFVINHCILYNELGDYIKFVPKNKYSSYLYLEPVFSIGSPLEIYITNSYDVDVKGLVNDKKIREKIINAHSEGIINFILNVINIAETKGISSKQMNRFLHEFICLYKNKELPFDFYREFNTESRFKYQFLGAEIMADNIDESMLQKINIEYNYTHIIMPVVNLIV